LALESGLEGMSTVSQPSMPDPSSVYGTLRLIVFVVLIIGACVYLLWKLPRDGPTDV
jgi:hypothetical protein